MPGTNVNSECINISLLLHFWKLYFQSLKPSGYAFGICVTHYAEIKTYQSTYDVRNCRNNTNLTYDAGKI